MQQEPEKPTKSAIKKANRFARLERKQRQKPKQGNEQQHPVTPTTLAQPVTAVILEEGQSTSSPLDNQVSRPGPEAAVTLEKESSRLSPLDNQVSRPDPETAVTLEKDSSRSSPLNNQVSRPDPETVKKRQNALTRILWTFIMIGGFIGNYPRTK